VSLDLYGRGYSARPDAAYDRRLFVDQIHELLAALHIERPVHLVGYSMGGSIVVSYAADHPQRVRRVVRPWCTDPRPGTAKGPAPRDPWGGWGTILA
jgi:pimeloyl-ACP methyl ester carboxylesterase